MLGILNSRRPDYQPGDFLGSAQWETDEGWISYQTKELNNGRLAMFGAELGFLPVRAVPEQVHRNRYTGIDAIPLYR